VNPGLNFYDIRPSSRCPSPLSHDCYNFTAAVNYMSSPAVREQIGVGLNRTWRDATVPFSVVAALNGDEETGYEQLIPTLLAAGVRVLCYNGEFDFAANYVGGEAWLSALQWPYAQQFNNTPLATWMVEGVPAGLKKSVQGLTLIRVNDAGHMVPMVGR
jgi:serine carboxypeptidase-like clade 4